MTRHDSEDGNRVSWKWIAGIAVTVLLMAGAAWTGVVHSRLIAVEERGSGTTARLMGVEATLMQMQSQLNRIELQIGQLFQPTPTRRKD